MFFASLPELVIRQYSDILGVSLLPSVQACLLCCEYFQHLKGSFEIMKNVTLVFCLSSMRFFLAADLLEMNAIGGYFAGYFLRSVGRSPAFYENRRNTYVTSITSAQELDPLVTTISGESLQIVPVSLRGVNE